MPCQKVDRGICSEVSLISVHAIIFFSMNNIVKKKIVKNECQEILFSGQVDAHKIINLKTVPRTA